ncbi:PREDICTED: snRNA-activating protein complex subunit 5 [Nanorana parkeri]|uniref:snRNA-activating protein complex subunit 5 n=1 Tax=Nanorana parkeri TaxID=125878 RepID=UPI0008543075|nr:PREDICTED: snRNA-activating protein complex subunit 5 [Nanorana parkeri]
MLSRLQELKKEEETLLKIKAALHDQLNRLKVEELALQSMISAGEDQDLQEEQPQVDTKNVDDETVINQTQLQLDTLDYNDEEMEEEEEEEEEDSDT